MMIYVEMCLTELMMIIFIVISIQTLYTDIPVDIHVPWGHIVSGFQNKSCSYTDYEYDFLSKLC